MNPYNEDYFENGVKKSISLYENYHWIASRSFREAIAYIDKLGLDDDSSVLDYGTAKGFLVRAFRVLGIASEGCDISEYALKFAPEGCWNCSNDDEIKNKSGLYTHIICKDVFEHLQPEELKKVLVKMTNLASIMMCVVPLGENNKYRIAEYNLDMTHVIIENEFWWEDMFCSNGWKILEQTYHVRGLKDNWRKVNPKGNRVFILTRKTTNSSDGIRYNYQYALEEVIHTDIYSAY